MSQILAAPPVHVSVIVSTPFVSCVLICPSNCIYAVPAGSDGALVAFSPTTSVYVLPLESVIVGTLMDAARSEMTTVDGTSAVPATVKVHGLACPVTTMFLIRTGVCGNASRAVLIVTPPSQLPAAVLVAVIVHAGASTPIGS